jgi:hypothetical protein
MTTDLLEERLEKLAIPNPDPGRVTEHVLSCPPQRQSRRAPRFIAAGVVAVVLIALVGYFVPAADTAMASTPAGDLLVQAGLVGAKDRITWVGSTATSSGVRVQLIGAYADSTRTVLLLRADPPMYPGWQPDEGLTDQFGRHYYLRGSRGDLVTGNLSAEFGELAWPDAITGARITLHLSKLSVLERPYEKGTPVQIKDVLGSWTLHATLGVDETTSLPLPAHFQFKAVKYSSATIFIDMEVAGVTADELNRRIDDGLKGIPVFSVDLLDPNGQKVGGGMGGYSNGGPGREQIVGYRVVAGDYVLRLKYLGYGEVERVLKIP